MYAEISRETLQIPVVHLVHPRRIYGWSMYRDKPEGVLLYCIVQMYRGRLTAGADTYPS
jgi:hypothetical protein